MPFNQASDKVWPITHPDGTAFKTDGTDMVIGEQVGKYYGDRYVGGVAGVTCATSGEGRMVWEFDEVNQADAALKALRIPEGYAFVSAVTVEVEDPFTAGDVDVKVGGTTVLSADVPLDGVAGMFIGAMTATPINRTINAGEDVTIEYSGTLTGTGNAKVIVEFTRI